MLRLIQKLRPLTFQYLAVPETPSALRVMDKTYSSIGLQWEPRFDGGKKQTFIISINDAEEIESYNDTSVIIHGMLVVFKLLN
jgi:hypothetical protein